MSVNTAHAHNGVLIDAGEYILLHCDSITMEFSGQDSSIFSGTKQGRIYLTSHRVIFNTKKHGDEMQSFSAPFIALSDVELEQPVFGANYIKGKVRAQPGGHFVGEVKFKLYFKAGGAIEYAQALLRAAKTAQCNFRNSGYGDDPPPYTPAGAWHEVPPPAYQPPPGYYGWLPSHSAFSGPAPNTVYMTDNPPPYPGISGEPPVYNPPPIEPFAPHCRPQTRDDNASWNGFSAPPAQPNQPPPYDGQGYNRNPQQIGFAQPPGQPYCYSSAGYQRPDCQPPPGYNPNAPVAAAGSAGAAGAMGFNMPPANSKEAEAMASAYNNTPYNPQYNARPSDMPPAYYDLPPNYDATRKNQ